MAELNTIVPVVIYLSLSFLAALWARKQSQKTSDSHGFIEEYFIGGRSMGGFVLAMSIIASYTSASSFVGGPGVAYTFQRRNSSKEICTNPMLNLSINEYLLQSNQVMAKV